MACQKSLFTYLGGTPGTTGSWKMGNVNGVSGTISNLDWGEGNVNPNTSPGDPLPNQNATFTTGNSIGTMPYLWIDTESVAAGVYTFTYTIGSGGCADTSTVTVTVVNGADSGTAATSLTYCSTSSTLVTMFNDWLDGTPDATGTWTIDPLASAAVAANNVSIPTDDTFNPSLVSVPDNSSVTLNFAYTVTVSGAAGCTFCTDTTNITVTVADAGDAGADGAVTLCNSAS